MPGTPRIYAPPAEPVAVRWMTCADAPHLAEFSVMPWADKHFRALADGEGDTRGVTALVAAAAADPAFPVGFLVHLATPLSLSLLNWGVHPGHRRAGVGSALAAVVLGRARRARRARRLVRADVDERDLDSRRFFTALGFAAVAVLRGRFLDADGYRMEVLP